LKFKEVYYLFEIVEKDIVKTFSTINFYSKGDLK